MKTNWNVLPIFTIFILVSSSIQSQSFHFIFPKKNQTNP